MSLLCLALLLAPGAARPAHGMPSTRAEVRASAGPSRLLAKKGKKAKGAKKKGKGGKDGGAAAAAPFEPEVPAAANEPVRIRSGGTLRATLKAGQKTQTVYVVDAATPMTFEVPGPGALGLAFYQILPKKKGKPATFVVSIDGTTQSVTVPPKPLGRAKLTGAPSGVPSKEKSVLKKIAGAGPHTVTVSAPPGSGGAVLRIDFIPPGSKKPAAVVMDPAAPAVASAVPEEEPDIPTAPPAVPEAPPPVPEAPPPVEVAAVVPAAAPPPAPEAPQEPAKPKEKTIEEKVASGELRDALLRDDVAEVLVVDTTTEQVVKFHRVEEEKSYLVMVSGPGVLTVRMHRLLDPARLGTPDYDTSYTFVIFENDVLLQQLKDKSEPAKTWQVDGNTGSLVLAQPKEYQLKLGPKVARYAFQITGAKEGMVVRYSFAAEERGLSTLALGGLDDEEDEDDGLGPIAAAPVMPTVVMQVNLHETVVVEQEDFIGFGLHAGTLVPTVAGKPGAAAGAQLSIALPFTDGALSLGVHATFQRLQLAVPIADATAGTQVDTTGTVLSLPLVGQLAARIRLGERLAMNLSAGGGITWVKTSRTFLESEEVATRWLPAGRVAAGFETEIGPGWLALEASELLVKPADFGNSLRSYSPGGLGVMLAYRLGM